MLNLRVRNIDTARSKGLTAKDLVTEDSSLPTSFKTHAGKHGHVFQNFSMTEGINIVTGFPIAWSFVFPLN
jgi:hypothetical protein